MEKLEDEYTVSENEACTVTLGPYTHTFYGNTTVYMKNGKVHRDSDQPAIISKGKCIYARDGLFYREEDRPAYESLSLKMWYDVNGLLHRDGDLPAVEDVRESRWYSHGKLHRETRDEDGYLLLAIKSIFPGSQYCLNDKVVDCVGNLLIYDGERGI
jgi:hypothetical protein